MIRGIEKFRDHFKEFSEQYVLIGGMACYLSFEEAGLEFHTPPALDSSMGRHSRHARCRYRAIPTTPFVRTLIEIFRFDSFVFLFTLLKIDSKVSLSTLLFDNKLQPTVSTSFGIMSIVKTTGRAFALFFKIFRYLKFRMQFNKIIFNDQKSTLGIIFSDQ